MTVTNRTINLGRIAELKARLMELRVLIANNCTAIVFHFDPMDADLQYVQNIKVSWLEITVKELKKQRKEFDQIAREIERLQGELGQNES